MFAANIFGGFFSYQYKIIGNASDQCAIQKEGCDLLLSWAASATGVVQFLTRISIGLLYDYFGFKKIFNVLMIINTINGVFCYQVRNTMWIYILCVELTYLVLAGVFAVFPAAVVKTFGLKYGPQVYTLVLLGSPASSVVDTINIKVLYEEVGELPILCFGAVMSVLAFLVCLWFNEKLDIENMDGKGLIEWENPK